MRKQSRVYLQTAGVYVMLTVMVVWGCLEFLTSRRSAVAASENLSACQTLATRLSALRSGVSPLAQGRLITDFANRIETAAQRVDIQPERLVRIKPQRPRRLGQSKVWEQSALVELEQVTLKQLVLFLIAVVDDAPELRVSTIRLYAPPTRSITASGEAWDTEVVVRNRFLDEPRS